MNKGYGRGDYVVRSATSEEIDKYLAKPGRKEVAHHHFENKSTTEPYIAGSTCGIRYYSDGSFEYYDYKGMKTYTSTLKTMSNEKRNLALTLEQARELYRKDAYTEALLLTAFTKEELEGKDEIPSWWDLKKIEGYFIDRSSNICIETGLGIQHAIKNVFATESQAKSALAMAQLSQLMKALGDECKVDWFVATNKFCINRFDNKLGYGIGTGAHINTYHFLAFKTASVRDAFLAKHEELIKQYFEL